MGANSGRNHRLAAPIAWLIALGGIGWTWGAERPKPDTAVVRIGSRQTEGPAAGLPSGASPGSISLWFARPTDAANQVLFVYGSSQRGRGRGLWLVDDDRLCFYFFGWPDDLHCKVPGGVVPDRWHHVAATYDGATARLYYDGRLLGAVQTKIDTAADGRFAVGRNLPDDGREFLGRVDDIKVLARALSAEEIQAEVASQARSHGEAALATSFEASAEEVGVERIVFAVRKADRDPHWYANFGYDIRDPKRTYYHDSGRLCLLDVKTGRVTTLLNDLQGGVRDPQVHYNGRTILFSYRKGGQPYYHLYEIGLDGSGLRQLTDGPYDDFEPTYLPDDEIVFCSSRCRRWVPCYVTQVAVLYRCNRDGRNLRQLSSNVEQENTPWVLPDGRILFQRWEYVDRSQVGFHHLWTMNPDGTGQMIFFGNMHPDTVMIDAKPIPGTRKVVASFSPGHGRTEHAGAITIVDPAQGPDAQNNARRITRSMTYRDPFPLTERTFLAAHEAEIVWLDDRGRSRRLYVLPEELRREGLKVHEPRPVYARPRERVLAARRDLARDDAAQPTGRVIVEDIYVGRNMSGVQRGEIKKLLVLEILPKPYNMFSGMEPLSYGGTFLLERVLGTVPVEADGSAYAELPALRSLFFVALDKNNMAVKRMQSFLALQPGESVGCVGCHDRRIEAPRSSGSLLAMHRGASRIEPIEGSPDLLDFPRDIQPILDRHCVACHDYKPAKQGGPMAGGIILSGDRGPMFSHSYYMLTISAQFADGRNLRKSNYPPRALGSAASPLLAKFDGSHYGARGSEQERRNVRLWIDTGAAYPGTYAALGTGMIGHYASMGLNRDDLRWPPIEQARQVLTGRCAACHSKDLALPDSPSDDRHMVPWGEGTMNLLASRTSQRRHGAFRFNRHMLYNLSRPELSLLLLAPLAKQAGGYAICGPSAPFAAATDPDYRKLLCSIQEAAKHLDEIKRFDMPGFKPCVEYVREMKRFGVLPETFDVAKEPIDVYRIDRKYWDSVLPGTAAGPK